MNLLFVKLHISVTFVILFTQFNPKQMNKVKIAIKSRNKNFGLRNRREKFT